MKIIIKTKTNECVFVLEDDTIITMTDKNIVFDDITVLDLNVNNSKIIEDLTIPEDWDGGNYYYFEQDLDRPLKPWGWILK